MGTCAISEAGSKLRVYTPRGRIQALALQFHTSAAGAFRYAREEDTVKNRFIPISFATLALSILPLAPPSAAGAPSATVQLQQMEQGCEETAEARGSRQAELSLYERLGGYDRILDLTREIVQLHEQNEAIKQYMKGVDGDALARHVADFVASGTGGHEKYTGRDLPSSHAPMKLTDADFLAAGGDIVKAMQNKSYGAEEIDEVVCMLVSLKDQVVFE
jgi:hemoglobin